MSHDDKKEKRTLFIFISIFFLLVMGIAVGGTVSYRNFEQEFRLQAEHQISAIAELKMNGLVEWRKERLGDAEFLYHNPAFSALVQRYFENSDDIEARGQLLAWLDHYQFYDQYDKVRLLDVTGAERLSIPTTPDLLDSHLTQDVIACLRSEKVTFLDFRRDTSAGGGIHLSILVPIFTERSNNHPLGVLVMSIIPQTYLYPYIQSWPTNSTSAETLLVRREGDEALFLNELRFKLDAALALRYPLTDTELPAVKAVLGQIGVVEGLDYRGESVLADVRAVPDSPWFLVSKMDTTEVYAPLRARLWGTLGLIGMAIFVAGAGLALVWRQGRIRFYQAQAEAAVALRESEEKMHSIFRVAPTGIGVVSNRVLLEVNPRICEMTGYSKEELVGQSARIFYPTQEDFEFVGREKYKQIAQKGSGAVETRWQKKDGSIIDILLASTPIDLADLSKGVTFTALDITERKRLEHETEERRLFLESVLAVAPDAIVTSDTRHMISEWNLGAERLFGYSSEEAVGRKIDELITGTDSQVLNEAASWTRQIQSRRGIAPTETVRYRKDGSPVNVIVSVAPILIDNEWVGGVAIYTNITERKRAEEALQKSEESLRLAVSAGRMGTWDRNFLSGQLNWSVECKTMFGLAPEVEMNDERFMHALHPEDRMPTDLAIREALEKQTDFDTEYRVIWPDGTIHWIAAQGHGYYNEAGQAIRMTGVTFEITERKQAEDEIRKLNAELEQRVRERTLQLETTNKELEAFSYSVSHDLRAPLRGIDGWSQALLEDYRDKLDEQGRQYIERVRFETRRMGQLIEDMLQLSRLTRTEVIKEQVNLSALAQAIAERLQAAEPLRKVDFTIQAGLTAEGDAHLLEVMLTNLLGNAVKFTNKRADARIEFGGTESQGQRAFFVRDNGAGFDIAYAQKLFGAFQRMHKVSEFPGIGIGLATVRRIIHRHGGRVWAEAEVDRGATFYFTLG